MHLFELCIVVALVCAATFQSWLTVRVLRSGLYERKQKIFQVQLIWLIPIIGAALVFSVLRDDERAERGPDQHQRG